MKTARLQLRHPIGIAMWDFSWLERRWPGAGYEDWELCVGELAERGYEAVRIDAYPHLLAADPRVTWELLPEWTTNDWGAPARCRVSVWPALPQFLEVCRRHGVRVALSSWFRQDVSERRLTLKDPELHGRAWCQTLRLIEDAGLLDAVWYVDLCNEWPNEAWARFFPGKREWNSAESVRWMTIAMEVVRTQYPDLPLCFSNTTDATNSHASWSAGGADLLEPHIWMATSSDFNARLDYNYERFDLAGYDRIATHAYALYDYARADWLAALGNTIDRTAAWALAEQRPLITTECWALVDYKDWPLLEWDWIKDICAWGVARASDTGAWAAMATSNFCGPQFRGMWRDIDWHREQTRRISSARLPQC
jgi:hypothetical protein